MMLHYIVNFYRADLKQHGSAKVKAADMASAVKFVVSAAVKKLVDLTQISVQLTSEVKKGGRQRFCDECLVNMACYGTKQKWHCKECRDKLRGS